MRLRPLTAAIASFLLVLGLAAMLIVLVETGSDGNPAGKVVGIFDVGGGAAGVTFGGGWVWATSREDGTESGSFPGPATPPRPTAWEGTHRCG